jgi:hypothetical protein
MREGFPHCLLFAISLAWTATYLVAAAPVSAQSLDHFKCYQALLFVPVSPPPPTLATVALADQFGVERQVTIPELEYRFCNPTVKIFGATSTGILDPDHHLTFYAYDPVNPAPIKGAVEIFNQFGRQKFEIETANVLAVPTSKIGPPPPADLDHFKCYFASGDLPKGIVVVELDDQFEVRKHKLLEPLYFCNPVEKTDLVTNDVTEIQNEDAHLACYTITPGYFWPPIDLVIANQFYDSTKDMQVTIGDVLCAPSRKLRFKLE